MEIVSLHLTGFKSNGINHNLNFKDRRNPFLMDTIADNKQYLLEVLSGVFFGFTNAEKEQYRGDKESVKTFTGLVTLELDNQTMIIERDFETDFTACLLSDTRHTRPIFQGKDLVDGHYSRPYIHMLKSIFPFAGKELIHELGLRLSKDENCRVADLLDVLYLLFTPQFKFTSGSELVRETDVLLNSRNMRDLQSEGHQQLQKTLERQRLGLEQVIKLQQATDRMNSDLQKLNALVNRLHNDKYFSENQQPEKKFEAPKNLNPLQFRADILLWKSLQVVKDQNDSSLRQLQIKRQRIEKFLDRDLAQYSKLPATFIRDIANFKKLTALSEEKQNMLQNMRSEIQQFEKRSLLWNRLGVFTMIVVFPLIFFVSYMVFKPMWKLIIPESLLLMLIIGSVFGHIRQKFRFHIYRTEEESHIIQKKLNEINIDLAELRKNAIFITDMAYLDNHIERYKKYRQLLAELKRISKEESRITNLLNSNTYTRQLPEYTEKYAGLIDVNRPDLENFLDEFVASRDETERRQFNSRNKALPQEISELIRQHENLLSAIKDIQARVLDDLQIEGGYASYLEALDLVDRKIKNIQHQQRLDYSNISNN
jgi:hypothetical protein